MWSMELLSQLENKDVINICTGTKLGFITDLEIDTCTGKICTIIVCGGKNGILGIFCDEIIYDIPWKCIRRIGSDAILVDVDIDSVER